jgi:hypothetical protein
MSAIPPAGAHPLVLADGDLLRGADGAGVRSAYPVPGINPGTAVAFAYAAAHAAAAAAPLPSIAHEETTGC